MAKERKLQDGSRPLSRYLLGGAVQEAAGVLCLVGGEETKK